MLFNIFSINMTNESWTYSGYVKNKDTAGVQHKHKIKVAISVSGIGSLHTFKSYSVDIYL